MIFFSTVTWAEQNAYIKSKVAIVYADQELTSAIGKIEQGKRIAVGQVARRRGTILPIVVSGRVAYIRIEDLILKDIVTDKEIKGRGYTQHEYLVQEEESDNLKENNFIYFNYYGFNGGNEWSDMTSSIGDDESSQFKNFNILIEHRPTKFNYIFGIGGGYYTNTTEHIKFSALTLEITAGYNLLRPAHQVLIDAYGGLSMCSGASISVADSTQVNRGQIFGHDIGLQARIFPDQAYIIHIGFSYKVLNLLGFSDVQLPSGASDFNLRSLSGFALTLGVSHPL